MNLQLTGEVALVVASLLSSRDAGQLVVDEASQKIPR